MSRITLTLDHTLLAQLMEIAREDERSLSFVARKAFAAYLKRKPAPVASPTPKLTTPALPAPPVAAAAVSAPANSEPREAGPRLR